MSLKRPFIWECDKCHKTVTVFKGKKLPKGWECEPENLIKKTDTTHLCDACATKIPKPEKKMRDLFAEPGFSESFDRYREELDRLRGL